MIEKTVHPIHFEDYSGQEFERLAFAYILRTEEWDKIDWYGQLGSDRGRDIWGILSNRDWNSNICYQCANHQKITFQKAKEDLDKICAGPNKIPSKFVLIIGGKISAKLRDKMADYIKIKNIPKYEIWSGIEFEERLRKNTPGLVQRFCNGVVFPEEVSDLSMFIVETKDFTDSLILKAYASCFDRPAFTTPFSQESNLFHFKKAISDTIEALQTGIHRLRDGTVVKRFPSILEISDVGLQKSLKNIVINLQKLRSVYDVLLRSGDIKLCGCGQEDCPVHILSRKACDDMDRLRNEILVQFKEIYPKFTVSIWR